MVVCVCPGGQVQTWLSPGHQRPCCHPSDDARPEGRHSHLSLLQLLVEVRPVQLLCLLAGGQGEE